jgi:hypothetical protein
MTSSDLELLKARADMQAAITPWKLAQAAEELADAYSRVDPEFIFSIYDKFWRKTGELGADLIEASGTDPRNNVPQATIKVKGESAFIEALMQCRTTLVGVTVETAGLRFAHYVDTHDYDYDNGALTGTANCPGIWDILSFYQIWPDWFLPIQAQVFSHAIFIGPIVSVIENMIATCALRLQSGMWEFVNNAASLNPDIRAWFGTMLQSNGDFAHQLKTPLYVVMSNPLLDGSPLVARTVRMESCATVIRDITRSSGVDVRVDLWLPGDAQPDPWANLDQPTYVVTVKDRSQITGPTGAIIDSVIRTVVDLEGSLLGNALDPILNPSGQNQALPDGEFVAPALGVNFVAPYAILEVPEPGEVSSILKCKVSDHTPKGWQHIIGGKSPKWLNDLINATLSWLIDSVMIVIGFTGVPSNLLDGFLNDAFLAFQLIEHYQRRADVGPYHPAIERFTSTGSSPYNIEALFTFVNALWDSRGYTSALAVFRNGEKLTLGKDVFRGGLMSIVYLGRKRMFTDYIENVMWRITEDAREITVQVGDGKAKEAPLAKHQRLITGLQEGLNVALLTPNN